MVSIIRVLYSFFEIKMVPRLFVVAIFFLLCVYMIFWCLPSFLSLNASFCHACFTKIGLQTTSYNQLIYMIGYILAAVKLPHPFYFIFFQFRFWSPYEKHSLNWYADNKGQKTDSTLAGLALSSNWLISYNPTLIFSLYGPSFWNCFLLSSGKWKRRAEWAVHVMKETHPT